MFFYKLKDKILISQLEYSELNRTSESESKESKEIIYALTQINPLKSRKRFSITEPSLMFLKEEGIHLLQKSKKIDGLRLLGGSYIESIGMYDKNINAIKRWKLEANQIFCPFTAQKFPEVYQLREENVFDCDMFIFCATVGVPSLGEEQEDVRMKQFKGNSYLQLSQIR
jgi:hypothetical protein